MIVGNRQESRDRRQQTVGRKKRALPGSAAILQTENSPRISTDLHRSEISYPRLSVKIRGKFSLIKKASSKARLLFFVCR
jgi:hypothetical protein